MPAGEFSYTAQVRFTGAGTGALTPYDTVTYSIKKNGVAGFGGTAGPIYYNSLIFSGTSVDTWIYGTATFAGGDTFGIACNNNDTDDDMQASVLSVEMLEIL